MATQIKRFVVVSLSDKVVVIQKNWHEFEFIIAVHLLIVHNPISWLDDVLCGIWWSVMCTTYINVFPP